MSLKGRYFLIFFIIFTPIYLFRLKEKLNLPFQEGDRVKIKGILTQKPYFSKGKQVFKLKGFLIKAESNSKLTYGDQIEVVGIVEKKESKSFLNQYQIKNPKISQSAIRQLAERTKKSPIKYIFQFRQKLEQVINQTLPEPHAGLLAGIFLGIQKSLAYDFYQALKTTGTLHIIVASGMNISLIAGALKDNLSHFLKRKPALIVSLVCTLIYCIMAGMNPPIIRAGLMAGALYLAHFTGREATGFWVLIITGAIMLFINPLFLFIF